MMNTDLHYSVETLDKLDPTYKNFLVPSDKIYYGKYAYKVTFVTPSVLPPDIEFELGPKNSTRTLEKHFRDKLYQYVGAPRAQDDSNRPEHIEDKVIARQKHTKPLCKQFVYFRSLNDLNKIIVEFKDSIESIEGPISQTHLDLLLSKQFRCEVRNNLWYKKYDYKVYMFLPYRTAYSYTKDQKKTEIREIYDFLKENLPDDSLRVTNMGVMHMGNYQYNSSNSLDFYSKSEQFDTIYPFISMMFNNWRMVVTKAYIK